MQLSSTVSSTLSKKQQKQVLFPKGLLEVYTAYSPYPCYHLSDEVHYI